jgi:hypothetical protein
MAKQFHRWTFLPPLTQLVVCYAALWPIRHQVVFELSLALRRMRFAPTESTPNTDSDEPVLSVIVEPTRPFEGKRSDSRQDMQEVLARVPALLNVPVLFAQLPYVVLNPENKEWVPPGFMLETWRGLTWPWAGLVFWWMAARGICAYVGTRRKVPEPRISRVEIVVGGILLCLGVVAVVGIVTSTPDDRADYTFMSLLAGTLLWGILGAFSLIAGTLQWRMRQSSTVVSNPT